MYCMYTKISTYITTVNFEQTNLPLKILFNQTKIQFISDATIDLSDRLTQEDHSANGTDTTSLLGGVASVISVSFGSKIALHDKKNLITPIMYFSNFEI